MDERDFMDMDANDYDICEFCGDDRPCDCDAQLEHEDEGDIDDDDE